MVVLAVSRFSRTGVVKTPSSDGNSPNVSTACFVSSCVRSAAAKKCARLQRDRSAERSAELIAAVILLVELVDLLGLRLRVHRAIPEEREAASLELVGSALRDDVHHAAVAASVLGLVAGGLEIEFLDRFEREELEQSADGVVVVVAAVDLVVDVAAVPAGNLRRELRALRRIRMEAKPDARNRQRKIGELPAVERKALDVLHVDDAADRRRVRFDER